MPFLQQNQSIELLLLLLIVVSVVDFRVILVLSICLFYWKYPSLPVEITIRQRIEQLQYKDASTQTDPFTESKRRSANPQKIPHIDITSTINIIKESSEDRFAHLRTHLERRLQPQTHEDLVRIALDLFARYAGEQPSTRPQSLQSAPGSVPNPAPGESWESPRIYKTRRRPSKSQSNDPTPLDASETKATQQEREEENAAVPPPPERHKPAQLSDVPGKPEEGDDVKDTREATTSSSTAYVSEYGKPLLPSYEPESVGQQVPPSRKPQDAQGKVTQDSGKGHWA